MTQKSYTLSELFGSTNELFFHNWLNFLLVALILAIITTALSVVTLFSMPDITDYEETSIDSEEDIYSSLFGGINWLILIPAIILSILLIPIYQISKAFVYLRIEGDKHTITEAFKLILSRYWQILLLTFLMVLIIFPIFFIAGFIIGISSIASPVIAALFILIFIFASPLLLYFLFVFDGVILRNKNAIETISYSFSLVKDNFWRTLGYFLLIIFMIGIIATIYQTLIEELIINTAPSMKNFQFILGTALIEFLDNFVAFYTLSFMVYYFIALENEKGITKGKKHLVVKKI